MISDFTSWSRRFIRSPFTCTGKDWPGSARTSIRWPTWTITLLTWPTVRSTSWARTIRRQKKKSDSVNHIIYIYDNMYLTRVLIIYFYLSDKIRNSIFAGCKWTLQQLRQHLRQAGVNDWLLWQKISVLISLTMASQCTGIPNTSNCFELYGFDILVDSDLKPWLLEVYPYIV